MGSKLENIFEIYNNSMCENTFTYYEEWDEAIIGYHITEEGNFSIVYSEDEIINCIIKQYNYNYEEAYDTYSYELSFSNNKSRSIAPLIINLNI